MYTILSNLPTLLLIVIAVYLVASNIRIVPQANTYVIERLGAYHVTWTVGLHFKIPVIDRIAKKVNYYKYEKGFFFTITFIIRSNVHFNDPIQNRNRSLFYFSNRCRKSKRGSGADNRTQYG